MSTIIAYIPVIHSGYIKFLTKHNADLVFILGKSITQEFRPLQKDIRALEPEQIVDSIKALKLAKKVEVLEAEGLEKLELKSVIMPDEVICHTIANRYFSKANVKFDSIFLRWDSKKSLEPMPIKEDEIVTKASLHKGLMAQAKKEGQKSADWWRQVGAVITKGKEVLLTGHNQHLPSEQQSNIDGDPRADFHKGEHIDKSTAIHAEAGLIAQAAKEGISLANTSIYVSTFPCPNCAKLIAGSGITELYFQDGYGMLDGERVLKDAGVKIIRVE